MPNLKLVQFEGDHGDIMMHPHSTEFFNLLSAVPSVVAVTNGSMRSPKWWKQLASIRNLSIVFSIDGLADTNHIYRINSDFTKIMKNAQSFIDGGGRASWKFIVFRHNQHQIEQARQLSQDMGFQDFQVIHSNRNWDSKNIWPVYVNGKYLYDIQPSTSIIEISPSNNTRAINIIRNNIQITKPNCLLDTGSMYINCRGHVLPCCMTSGKTWKKDIDSQLWQRIVGDVEKIDINHHSMADILNTDFYQKNLYLSFQDKKTMHPTCLSCCNTI
jgi:hypothetical protein